jgi:myosin heavy subunit
MFRAVLTVNDGVEDMTTVENIDENGININLKVRYAKDLIYVRVHAPPLSWLAITRI